MISQNYILLIVLWIVSLKPKEGTQFSIANRYCKNSHEPLNGMIFVLDYHTVRCKKDCMDMFKLKLINVKLLNVDSKEYFNVPISKRNY